MSSLAHSGLTPSIPGEGHDTEVLAPRPPATPGPWKACGTVYEHMNAEIRSGAKGQGVAIAQVWDADNGFSNALLLAAAPQLRDSLLLAISHIEHMAAWITRDNRGYSFEALGEDMATIKAPLRDITPTTASAVGMSEANAPKASNGAADHEGAGE